MNIVDIETLPLLSYDELTQAEQCDFEYILPRSEGQQLRFVRYHDDAFDTFEAAHLRHDDWDAIFHLTYDSGLLFKFSEDHESVTVARFY